MLDLTGVIFFLSFMYIFVVVHFHLCSFRLFLLIFVDDHTRDGRRVVLEGYREQRLLAEEEVERLKY